MRRILMGCVVALMPFLAQAKTFKKYTHEHHHSRVYSQVGAASYYSNSQNGHKTASGDRYEPYLLTAASKTYPLGTYVKVTNISNHKQVIVLINDHGPYVGKRVIDLSREAAIQLGFIHRGLAWVEIHPVTKST